MKLKQQLLSISVSVMAFCWTGIVHSYECDYKLERLAKKIYPGTNEWVQRTVMGQGSLAKNICADGKELWENPEGYQANQVRGLPVLVTTLINFSSNRAVRDVIALQLPRVDCTEDRRDHYIRLIPLRESFEFEPESYFQFPSHVANTSESKVNLSVPNSSVQVYRLEGGTGVEELLFQEGARAYALTLNCY